MTAQDVLLVLDTLAAAAIPVWLDGGWGVDALVGVQTRHHDDVDIVIALEQVEAACQILALQGLTLLIDERPTRLVLGDTRRSVDLHPVRFDVSGAGLQSLPDGGEFRYPPEGFSGRGLIGGRTVSCITAETQDLCHRGYEPDEKDRHDMQLLHTHFRLTSPWPEPCQRDR